LSVLNKETTYFYLLTYLITNFFVLMFILSAAADYRHI